MSGTSKPQGTGSISKHDLALENERLKTQLEGLRSSRMASNLASVARETVKWGSLGFFGWKSIESLAGKATSVDAAIEVCGSLSEAIADLAPHWAVSAGAWLVAAIAIYSNIRVRKNNRALIHRTASMVKRYEALSDPNRSSSGLGEDGLTHERDQI